VFLGGEGTTEVGHGGTIGVLEAFIQKVQPDRWLVGGRQEWRGIKKYRAGAHRTAEQNNVLGLALQAAEAGAEALVFTRDRADVHDDEARYEAAIAKARELFPSLRVAGRLARPTIEGWVLAASGHRDSDRLDKDEALAAIETAGIQRKSRDAYVVVIQRSALDLSEGHSLAVWLGDVRAAFVGILD
jgi:hypothetical protein